MDHSYNIILFPEYQWYLLSTHKKHYYIYRNQIHLPFLKHSPVNYAQNLKNYWRIIAKNGRSVFLHKKRFECVLMDHPCEEVRYRGSHTLLDQQEKESLQGDFLPFELTVGKNMLLLHLK